MSKLGRTRWRRTSCCLCRSSTSICWWLPSQGIHMLHLQKEKEQPNKFRTRITLGVINCWEAPEAGGSSTEPQGRHALMPIPLKPSMKLVAAYCSAPLHLIKFRTEQLFSYQLLTGPWSSWFLNHKGGAFHQPFHQSRGWSRYEIFLLGKLRKRLWQKAVCLEKTTEG